MQLTGGQFRGHKVEAPNNVRPTLSKVREGVFNILMSHFGDFSKLTFLDMFAGSGIISLEALSRGFKQVVGYEKNPHNFKIIKKNAHKINANIEIFCKDSLKALKNDQTFDVIYIDPPWEFEYGKIIAQAVEHLKKNGLIIVEADNKKPTQKESPSCVKLIKEKMYGRCKISIYTPLCLKEEVECNF